LRSALGVTEVSARLRAARERAGRTIQDISASTKIRAVSLEAIERGNFAALPGDFYTRAFLRAYASELGLSAESILQDYESEHPRAQPSRDEGPNTSTPLHGAMPPSASKPSSRPVWSYVTAVATNTGVVIALLIVVLVVAVVRSRPTAAPATEAGAVGTSGNAAPAPARAAAAAPRPDVANGLTMEIQATGTIWVTGAADGKRVLYRLLAPGERVTVKARDELAFRVGDAAAFTYSINGVTGKPLGGPGEVRDVEITRDNYRSFGR
jgi:cytoskeletal protein RodZ